jgi:hypothetical protein
MRAGFESGNRSGARGGRDEAVRLSKELQQKDKDFETALEKDLSRDQQKRYEQWKESREKSGFRYHRRNHQHAPGGNL